MAAIIEGSDGHFYGTTAAGGLYGKGTVFSVTREGLLTNLASFDGTNGSFPTASLVKDVAGDFYGTTYSGGLFNQGSIFKITTGGVLTSLASFDGTNGSNPNGAMIVGADGNFYGTTPLGGLGNHGTVFRFATNGLVTTLVSFGVTNGANPTAPLLLSTNGLLYGTTSSGGADTSIDNFGNVGSGTVFSVTTNGALTLIGSFYRTNGALPGGLIEGSDGFLYGVTRAGGASSDIFLSYTGYGTVFKMAENGTITTLVSFDGTNGAAPFAGLTQGLDGNYYGVAAYGGSYTGFGWPGRGVIFQINSNGAFSSLASFGRYVVNDGEDGALPVSALTLSSDGNFYGTTEEGGMVGRGAVYRFNFTAPPTLQVGAVVNGVISFSWNSAVKQTYQVQFCDDLNQMDWNNLGNPIWATNTISTASDNISESPQRFYRVGLVR